MALATGAMLAVPLHGCVGVYAVPGYFKDNPIDRGLNAGGYIKDIRAELRKAFPPGSRVADVRRELEGIGARCSATGPNGTKVVCHYAQWLVIEYRFLIYRTPWDRADYRIRVEILEERGRVRDFAVCIATTATQYEWGRITKRTEGPLECEDIPLRDRLGD